MNNTFSANGYIRKSEDAFTKENFPNNIRKLQLLHNRHNALFRYINFFCISALWLNIVLYAVLAVVESIPYPEYLLLPSIAVSFTLYVFIILKQMSNVRMVCARFLQDPYTPSFGKKFTKSIRPLGLEIGEYFVVDQMAPLIFLGVTLDYFINGILAMR